jgi:thiol-disulfide isomerase/thioredoxin
MKMLFFVCLCFILITGNSSVQANNPASENGIDVFTFDEFRHWLTKETDSIYVINFWATWCAPCVKEIPAFEKLHETYSEKKVKVLFVSLDFPAQLQSRVIPFIERMKMDAEVVLLNDPNSNRWIPIVSEKWSGAIPATLIYSKDFNKFYEQEFTFDQLQTIILPLIN